MLLIPREQLTELVAALLDRFDVVDLEVNDPPIEDLIGGQIKAGFLLTGFYEDYWEDAATLLNVFSPTSMATRALKPAG